MSPAILENIGDTVEDIEEKISDIEGQIVCKEKSGKGISSIIQLEKQTHSNIIGNKNLRYDVQKEQYSISSCANSWNKIIIFNDLDLDRKAFKLDDNNWEYELETMI